MILDLHGHSRKYFFLNDSEWEVFFMETLLEKILGYFLLSLQSSVITFPFRKVLLANKNHKRLALPE